MARPILAKANSGQSNSGQSNFLANTFFWPIFLMSWWGPKGWGAKPRKSGGPKGGGLSRRPKPRKSGGPRGGAQKGARTVGAQNFALFSPLPPQFFLLFSISFGLFRGILVVFGSAGALKCARLEFSGCRVKPRRHNLDQGRRRTFHNFAVVLKNTRERSTLIMSEF